MHGATIKTKKKFHFQVYKCTQPAYALKQANFIFDCTNEFHVIGIAPDHTVFSVKYWTVKLIPM
jgi:hypothetical protein